MKICSDCLLPKDESEFYAKYVKKDGSRSLSNICKNCTYKRHYESQKKYYWKNVEAQKIRAARYVAKVKRETISAYGGRCACCGEDQIEFLCLDHIHNDGAEKRKSGEHKLGFALYAKLRRNGFPDEGLQVLCYNCNAAKQLYGICPHQTITPQPAWRYSDLMSKVGFSIHDREMEMSHGR